MTKSFVRMGVLLAVLAVAVVGVTVLSTPVEARSCPHLVACPAIAKLCPNGEVACRVNPCSCALVCVPEGVACNN